MNVTCHDTAPNHTTHNLFTLEVTNPDYTGEPEDGGVTLTLPNIPGCHVASTAASYGHVVSLIDEHLTYAA